MMAGAAELGGRLDQQRSLRTSVMSGMASQAAQVCLSVLLADLRQMAALAPCHDDVYGRARVAFDLAGITAGVDMIGAGSMATFTAAHRYALAV